MTTERATADLLSELELFRRAHAGAARIASSAFELVTKLRACRVWLPCAAGVAEVADRIYYNSGYDACERFDSVEEFAAELRPHLESVWTDRDTVAGVEAFVLRPVFADKSDYLHELGMGYLRGCSPDELDALDVRPLGAFPEEAVRGLSASELVALASYHRSATLTLVNRLRHLETALCYVRSALGKGLVLGRNPLVHDGELAGLVERLAETVSLEFSPPTAKHFGTEADKTNPLRRLDADEMLLAPLLSA